MNLKDAVKYVSVLTIVVGILLVSAAIYIPNPDVTVKHITEYDNQYASDNHDSIIDIPIISDDDDTQPSDVHSVYQISNFTSAEQDALSDGINSPDSFATGNLSDMEYLDRFIVEFDDGTLHVYEGTTDGIYPPDMLLYGAFFLISGIGLLYIVRKQSEGTPDNIQESDHDIWEFEMKD